MKTREQLRMLILAVLERQPEHGYAIAQAIKARSEGLLTAREGSLYPALHALEAEGLVESEEHDVGGRVRREYRLTEKGKGVLAKARKEWEKQVRAVGAVIGGQS
ncbi:PadR family transcriptional regulator [Deinococcus malanensis]|nr:helix-turn-helix transcriptional regulator [Deinococcus malanensis]